MISDIDRLKIEKIYYDQVNDSDYSRNKALILIATKIGINYKDIETAHNYLKKVILTPTTDFKEYVYLGGIYMHLGLLEKSWKYYKYRTRHSDYDNINKYFDPTKEWNRENIKGKTLYILAEQGIGDCIMWARYMPLIKDANIKILVTTNYWKKIIPLLDYILSITAGANNQLIITDTVEEYDYWIYLADLTYIFNIHFKNWLPFYTYIKPKNEYVQIWKERLKDYKIQNKLIGINCTGIQKATDTRRIDLDDLSPVLDMENVSFINLNIDSYMVHKHVIKLKYKLDEKEAFIDTAAIMKHLDLFITVDTSLVHLAGAMNIPTILLCIKDSEWRWFNSEKCHWYPSVKIFKQKRTGDWSGLYEFIETEIKKL
uniref:Glycosyltransferase n=1 Tax=viral metagenome TaxID=1070528 RepID=A0A6C0B4D0_9ZZZZ